MAAARESAVTFAAAALAVSTAAIGWARFVVVPSWNTVDTPISGAPHARAATQPPPALARRVVVIVLDGLGYKDALAAPELEPLRQQGAFRRMDAAFPTFTSPAITSMVLGLSPRDSGVRLNGDAAGATGVDSLLASAWSAGVFVRVRSRGYKPFETLVRPPEGADVVGGRWAFVADRALARTLPAPSSDGARAIETWWVHLGEVDDAGHLCGSACEAYRAAARDAGQIVTQTASVLDRARDLLLLVSDHGMREAGGHGGDEPGLDHAFLLAWGARVRPGVELEPRPLRDFAPTAAVAMGVAAPSSSLGAPMLDLWNLTESEAAAAMQVPFEQTAEYACRLEPNERCAAVEATRAALGRGEGAEDARQILQGLAADREAGAARREARSRGVRGAIALAFAVASLAFTRARLSWAWPEARHGLLSPLPAAAVYAAVLGGYGYRPTLSSMAAEDIFVPHALQAAALGAVALALVGRLAGWSRREATFALWVVTLGFVVVAAFAGADSREVLSPLFGCLVVQLVPLLGATALGGIAIAASAPRPRCAAP